MMIEFLFDSLLAWDRALTEILRSAPRNSLFDFLMPLISEKRMWVLPILSVLAYAGIKNKKQGLLLFLSALLVIALADGSATTLKGVFLRLRPNQTDPAWIIERPYSSSFPSNHAANAFALATLFSIYYPRMAWVFLAAAALVGYSKIYLTDHYLLDVLAGAALGIGFAWLVAFGSRRLKERWEGSEPFKR
jgi:undecaprenyl-diphosphatase